MCPNMNRVIPTENTNKLTGNRNISKAVFFIFNTRRTMDTGISRTARIIPKKKRPANTKVIGIIGYSKVFL